MAHVFRGPQRPCKILGYLRVVVGIFKMEERMEPEMGLRYPSAQRSPTIFFDGPSALGKIDLFSARQRKAVS